MRCSLLSVALLLVASSASPLAGVDQPITDEEFAKINELGFNRRNAPIAERTVVDQPITDEEYTKISALGLDKRETLDARNNRKSCGKTINGERAGGHGVWCPVDQYLAVVNQFCTEYAGAQVRYQYKLSHTYSVFLTNQDHASERGPPGIVIFTIYNTKLHSSYVVNKGECVDFMRKQSNKDSKCYGKKHDDTEGGYWNVDGVGIFGSEVYRSG